MTHSNEHLQVRQFGRKKYPCDHQDTLQFSWPGIFCLLGWFGFYRRAGECYKDRGYILRDREMRGTGLHHAEFTKNQQKVFKKYFMFVVTAVTSGPAQKLARCGSNP